jgi:outer membrane lipoprotein carrier protein
MRFLQSTARALSLAASIFLCLSAAGQSKSMDVHQLADNVDKRYNSISSLEAKFTELYRGGGMSRTESGTMYLKKPGKMRWDYSVPRAKVFVTDGKNAWFYVPGEKQARRASVKDLDDLRSPLRYLLGKTKLEKEFEGLSLAPDAPPSMAGNTVLRGVPKSMADRVSQVLLEITSEYRIARIYIEELDGSSTEFRFLDQKDNVAVADQRFKFSPPPGVEVMEAKELEP